MSSIIARTIAVVLGLKPSAGIPALIGRARAVVTAIQGNPKLFPSPVPSVAVALTHITELVDAQTAFKNRLSTAAVRDDKKQVVITDLKQYHAYVIQLANADPEQAQIIAEAASMTLRKLPTRHKSDLAVKPMVEGAVKVVAKAVKGARSHLWQYSLDQGKTWLDAPATTGASTEIHNLPLGVSVMYRQRPVTKSGPGDWSQPISAIVA